MPVTLPQNPQRGVYEDFISAWLSALGYFIETHVQQRNVLELDVVGSDFDDPPRRILFEAKSGGSGFSDLFKVFGWRTYLGIPRGIVVANQATDAPTQVLLAEVATRTNTETVVIHPTMALWDSTVRPITAVDPLLRQRLLEAAWHYRIAARRAYAAFERVCRSNRDDELFARARGYDLAVEASFFSGDASERITRLYRAFTDSPNITGEFVARFAGTRNITIDAAYRQLENLPDALHIQHVMMLEHRARTLIVRHSLDVTRPTPPVRGRRRERTFWDRLPVSFRDGHQRLHELTFKARIPYLLQVFTEYFGGMHTQDRDLTLLSQLTDLSRDQVDEALGMLDMFFPGGGAEWSWRSQSHNGRLTRLKLCPAIARGSGALLHLLGATRRNFAHLDGNRRTLYQTWHASLVEVVQAQLDER